MRKFLKITLERLFKLKPLKINLRFENMRALIISVILILQGLVIMAQPGNNMTLLSNWNNLNLPTLSGKQRFNDVWGWYDSINAREYAILGSIDSVYFINITDPYNPVIADVEPGRAKKITWRDIDTYKNYCYVVCDGAAGSLQIFDMKYLPDSVHLVYDSDSLLNRSHTIYRSGDFLYCNTAYTKDGGRRAVQALSLADPEKPTLAGIIIPPVFSNGPLFNLCHDSYVRNDTLYCSGEGSGLFIYDWRNKLSPRLIGSITNYSDKGYNHSSWLTDDSKYLVFTDENLNLGVKIFDVSDLDNMEEQSVFYSNPGTLAHNPYIKNNHLYLSYYEEGVVVYDIQNPKNPVKIASYDTYPDNPPGVYNGFYGAWAAYPFLPSGNILVSDMTYGLFVLGVSPTLNSENLNLKLVDLYPNPIQQNQWVNLEFSLRDEELLEISLYDIKGIELKKQIHNGEIGTNKTKINLSEIPSGVYLLKISGSKSHICRKIVVQ